MVIDTSAIALNEPEASEIEVRIADDPVRADLCSDRA